MSERETLGLHELLGWLRTRSLPVWMSTFITSTRLQRNAALYQYLAGLSPKNRDKGVTVLLVFLNGKEIEGLMEYLGRRIIVVERDSSGLPIVAVDAGRAVIYLFLRLPLKNGAGKDLCHVFKLDLRKIVETLQRYAYKSLPIIDELNNRTVSTGISTTGGSGFVSTSIMVHGYLPISLRSDGIILMPEDPLWHKSSVVSMDIAIKLALMQIDPAYRNKIIMLFNAFTRSPLRGVGEVLDIYMVLALENYGIHNILENRQQFFLGNDYEDLQARIRDWTYRGFARGATLFLGDAALIRRDAILRAIEDPDDSTLDRLVATLSNNAASILFRQDEINNKDHSEVFKIAKVDLYVPDDIFLKMTDATVSELENRVLNALNSNGFNQIIAAVTNIHAVPKNVISDGILTLKITGDAPGLTAITLRRGDPHKWVKVMRDIIYVSNERKDPFEQVERGRIYIAQRYLKDTIKRAEEISKMLGMFNTYPESLREIFNHIPGFPRINTEKDKNE